ncbi:acyltransferase family protein [Dyadobacter arcticus]|uniref:Peptidoglycan/LPS O-acetylase OafA/YrhL n=1 Tax=Dyadobacter arcticus TaxID=1078754 RepID=A0ABX0UQN7_9BACT|nr:acyltransferase [Dyadobacter arcticus]NIJ55308.1 peptidoglycan/LPS O-acetylase OafA/YrhL [Dyadobacter arcticus]
MLNSIQILRAIAALLVVFAHFEFVKPAVGGFGVDIFFVISGFIMAYIVDKNPDAFLYRRLVRIVPIYWFMTLLTVVLFLFKPTWFRNVIINSYAVIKSLLFIPYRIEGSGPILSLGWTLNYEMFFYVVIALCIGFFGSKKGMTICLLFLPLFVLVFNIFPPTSYVLAFYSGSIVLEFVIGSLLFYYWKQEKNALPTSVKNLGIVLGVLSFGYLIIADHLYDPRVYRFLVFGIPALCVTNMFLILEEKVNPKNKVHALAILLGDASYAMYLVHPFVIYAFIRLVFKRFQVEGVAFELTELIVTLIVVCLVSIAIHKWFEKPVMKKLKQLLDRRFDSKKSLNLSK